MCCLDSSYFVLMAIGVSMIDGFASSFLISTGEA
jgi:hypothetical protein